MFCNLTEPSTVLWLISGLHWQRFIVTMLRWPCLVLHWGEGIALGDLSDSQYRRCVRHSPFQWADYSVFDMGQSILQVKYFLLN